MPKLYFVNDETDTRYEVLSLDRSKGTVTLKGDIGEFEQAYDKDKFASLGYRLVKEEATD